MSEQCKCGRPIFVRFSSKGVAVACCEVCWNKAVKRLACQPARNLKGEDDGVQD